MAFSTKMTEIAQRSLSSVAVFACLSLIRADTLNALEDLCARDNAQLRSTLRQATELISKLVASMDVYVGYALPGDGSICVLCSSPKINTIHSQLLEREDEHVVVRCTITSQTCVDTRTADGPRWICLPISLSDRVARGVLLVDCGSNVGSRRPKQTLINSEIIDFLESAATLLGTTIDLRCKEEEGSTLDHLHDNHNKLGQGPVSTRSIYRASLGALYRQLISTCRISIWQLRPKHIDQSHSASGRLSLFIKLKRVQNISVSATPITAVVYLDGVQAGRTCTQPTDSRSNGSLEFTSERFTLPLRKCWLSSRLRIELWRHESKFGCDFDVSSSFLGLVEITGSYFLHLPGCSRAYEIVGRPLPQSATLMMSLSIHTIPSGEMAHDLACYSENENPSLSGNVFLSSASVSSMLYSPGQYVCVFCGIDGVELGRTTPSSRSLHPEWTNLHIPLSHSCEILVKLMCSSPELSDSVIGMATLPRYSLIYLPRSKAEVKLRMPITSDMLSKETATDVGASHVLRQETNEIVLILRIQQVLIQLEPQGTHSSSPAATDPISTTRLVDGVLEFQSVGVELAPAVLSRIEAACFKRVPCHLRCDGSVDLIVVPFNDLAVKIGQHVVGPEGGTNFATILACSTGCIDMSTFWFVRDVTRRMEANVRYSRQRELRDSARSYACRQILVCCNDWACSPLPNMLDDVLHVLSQCLPGCSIYFLLLQPGGSKLVCVACTTQSKMCGTTLLRGQDASFNYVGPARNRFAAPRGFGIHVSTCTLSWQLPFACVPLENAGSMLGILGADTFDYVSKCREGVDSPPEDGVLQFLQAVGSIVGRAVDLRRRCDSLAMLHMTRSDLSSFCYSALLSISRNLLLTTTCELWELDADRQPHVVLQADANAGSNVVVNSPIHVIEGMADRQLDDLRSITQMDIGKLLQATLYASHLKPHFVGNAPRRMIVPFVGLENHKILVVNLRFNSQPRAMDVAYVLTVARRMQGALLVS